MTAKTKQFDHNININGSLTVSTDLAVTEGGTGASTSSGARTNLGLVIGTDIVSTIPVVTTIVSNATPTINTGVTDHRVTITALATAITSMTTNLTGTPNNFQRLIFRIKDDGTARAITWGASFEATGVPLPTTTVISKRLIVGFIYDSVTSKWGCVASVTEA